MRNRRDWQALLRQNTPRVIPGALRSVVLRGERQWQLSLLVLAAVCAVILSVFFPWQIVNDIRLNLGGMAGRDIVLEAVYANRVVGDNILVRRRHVFEIQFRFSNGQGQNYQTKSLYYGYLDPGTKIEVEFLPSDPSVARLKGGFFVPGGTVSIFWSAAFIILPFFGFWSFRRWRNRRAALLVHGVAVQGIIERVSLDHPQDRTHGRIELIYPVQGSPVRLTETVEIEIYRRAREIAEARLPVSIIYNPHLPNEHIIIELMG